MAEELFIPKLGQTVEEVTLVKWNVKDGDKVKQGQEVMEVETDKAVFPVEATASGIIHIGPFANGAVVPVLEVVAIIGKPEDKFTAGGVSAPTEAEQPAEVPAAVESTPVAAATAQTDRVFASPRARKLADSKGIDLTQVPPTGDDGVRVVEKDVLAFLEKQPKATPVAQNMAAQAGIALSSISGSGAGGMITKTDVERAMQQTSAVPAAAPVAAAPLPAAEVTERLPLRGVRGIIAERMGTSVHTTARVTLFMDVDATEFVAMRDRLKARLKDEWGFAPSYNDMLAKMCAIALRKFPYMNARLAPDAVELLGHVNIGLAVDTERGLLVPVAKDADKLSLRQIGARYRELAEAAKNGRALPDDLTGGTFTITNLGMFDVDCFTPVINLPEACILGVGRIAPAMMVKDGQGVVRQKMTLSLVFDHRVVDGAPAARFLQYIKDLIEEPYLWISALQEA
jgi:pyruvate dehydrogenase E2 component (dihydrolipoamide acetyltransferase)